MLNLSTGDIALIGLVGSVITAVASGVAAWVGAYVKGRMDVRAAAIAAHREFLLGEFQPLLTYLKVRPQQFAMLYSVFSTKNAKDIDEACDTYRQGLAKVVDPHVYPLIQRRGYAMTAMHNWTNAEVAVNNAVFAHLDRTRVVAFPEVKALHDRFLLAGILFHEAIQRLIFAERLGQKLPETPWRKRMAQRLRKWAPFRSGSASENAA